MGRARPDVDVVVADSVVRDEPQVGEELERSHVDHLADDGGASTSGRGAGERAVVVLDVGGARPTRGRGIDERPGSSPRS